MRGIQPVLAVLSALLVASLPAAAAPAAPSKAARAEAKPFDAQYNQLLRRAARETAQGQHAQAMLTYRQILSLYPDDLTASRGYADVLMAMGQYDEAETFLTQLLGRVGHDGGVRRSLGEIHRVRKKYDLYLEDVLAVLENTGDDERISLSWALSAFEDLAKEATVAARIEPAIRKLLASSPGHPELRILLGDALLRRGDEKGALAEVVEADRQSKSTGNILFLFGDELYGSGRSGVAYSAYMKASEESSDPAFKTSALTRAAEVATESNRLQDAVAAYQAVALATPETTAGFNALRAVADIQSQKLHDYQAALQAYQTLEHHPELGEKQGDLYLRMADCHLRIGQPEEAKKDVEKLKGTKADQETQAEGAFLAAEILFFSGDFAAAQTAYQDVAQNFTRTQKTNDAVGRYLQIVKAQNQGETDALKSYAEMERLTRIGDSTAVVAAAQALESGFPASDFAAEGLVREAEVLRGRGKSREALSLCSRAVAEHPKARVAPTALALMGDIYLTDLGDKDHALETYERLLNEYPQNLLSAEVRRTVEKLRRSSES